MYAGCDLSAFVRGVPLAVWLSNRLELGSDRRGAGAPARRSLPVIEGRSRDMLIYVLCSMSCCEYAASLKSRLT